jgi:AcrR family transcriptional regulator
MTSKTRGKGSKKASIPRSKLSASRRILRKSEATHRRLLDAAASVFAAVGYGEALLTQIASEAKMHVTALYYYFDTKEALAEAVLDDVALRTLARIDEALTSLPENATYREKVTAYIATRIEMTIKEHNYLLAHGKIFHQVPAEVRHRHHKIFKRDNQTWRSLLVGAMRAGEIRSDLDPDLTAMFMIGAINWAVEWLKPDPISHSEASRQLTLLLFEGLQPHMLPAAKGRRPAAKSTPKASER